MGHASEELIRKEHKPGARRRRQDAPRQRRDQREPKAADPIPEQHRLIIKQSIPGPAADVPERDGDATAPAATRHRGGPRDERDQPPEEQ